MTDTTINKDTVDINGNKLLWDNYIKNVYFYDSSSESWGASASNLSWYLENTLPSDSFYGTALDSDKWSFFNTRGTISGSVSNCLKLDIIKNEVRGGITSEGKWSLLGDFDIKLYIDESSYYNEYRAISDTGLTVSLGDSYKYRISKTFDGSSIGYSAKYISGFPSHTIGWLSAGEINTSVGGSYITCLRLMREGNSISSYVGSSSGFTLVGSGISGSIWSDVADVEIEAQTEDYNTYKMDVLGVLVSGTLSTSKEFSSPFRSSDESFPERSVFITDSYGLSILDESDSSLWMRFVDYSGGMFRNTESKISADNGKVYYTTPSGLVCLDFVGDKAVIYKKGSVEESDVGICGRNFDSVFLENTSTSSFVPHDEINDVSAKTVGTNHFVVAATVSGVGLYINESEVKTGVYNNIQTISITDMGGMLWNEYDSSSGEGVLYYRDSILDLLSYGGSTFEETSCYTTSTSPVSLSSADINSICSVNGKVVLGNSFGIDYIDGVKKTSYGPINVENPFSDPYFSSYLGIGWYKFVFGTGPSTESSFPNMPSFDVVLSNVWSTVGTSSVRMSLNSGHYVQNNSVGGIYQSVDFSSTDRIYFDYKVVTSALSNLLDFEVVVNGSILHTVSDLSGSKEKLNNVIDVSSYSGNNVVEFRIKSKYSGVCDTSSLFYVDNIRTVQSLPDYAIIPTSTHRVLEVLLLDSASEQKIFFSTEDGYGCIDVFTNTLDYFVPISEKVPLSVIVSSEYVEYLDEV